jgi:hypothetical protein
MNIELNGATVALGLLGLAFATPLFIKEDGGYLGKLNQGVFLMIVLSCAVGSFVSWLL